MTGNKITENNVLENRLGDFDAECEVEVICHGFSLGKNDVFNN
jgi:hypothetical protein